MIYLTPARHCLKQTCPLGLIYKEVKCCKAVLYKFIWEEIDMVLLPKAVTEENHTQT